MGDFILIFIPILGLGLFAWTWTALYNSLKDDIKKRHKREGIEDDPADYF